MDQKGSLKSSHNACSFQWRLNYGTELVGFRKTLGFEPLTVTATGTKSLQTKYHFGQQIKNQRYKKVTMKKIFRIFEKKKLKKKIKKLKKKWKIKQLNVASEFFEVTVSGVDCSELSIIAGTN